MAATNGMSSSPIENKENTEAVKPGGKDFEPDESATHGSSPRRMRDIHLDGSADNMPGVDPYMLDDKDLDIQSEADVNAGSVYSDLSGPSWKSLRTPRTKPPSAASSQPRSSIASRARQIKNHEGEPFLSIDLMPQGTPSKSESKQRGQSRSSFRASSCQTLVSAVSSESFTQASGRNGFRPARTRVLSATSSYSSPVKDHPKPNHHVKMPFKQGNGPKTSVKPVTSSPSHGLTERTAVATHVFNKILKEQKPSKTTYIQGRLLKARLKPLEPVQPIGPTIHQCRGIVAETRTYGQSQSRTFQRWKAIMAGGPAAHQHVHHPRLPACADADIAMATSNGVVDIRDIRSGSVCESVHQTSQASSSPSPTPRDLLNPDIDYGELEYMPDVDVAKDKMEEQTSADGVTSELLGLTEPKDIISTPLPRSPSGPGHCSEDITNLQGPDLQTPQASRLGMSSQQEITHNEETLNNNTNPIGEPSVLPSATGTETYCSESVISGSTSFQPSDKGDNSSPIHQAVPLANKRPQSASYLQTSVPAQPASRRPRTAVDSASRKAVRFADQSTQGGNAKDEEEASIKPKSSCRPRSLDSGFHDREDPEDDHSGGRGNKTFLTQQPGESARNSSAKSGNSSHQSGRHNASQGKKAGLQENSQHSSQQAYKGQTNSEHSSEDSHLSTLQEIYGLKPACLSYMQEASKSKTQSKQAKPKQSKDKKGSVSNIKQKLDDRFAMYKNKKEEKKKESNVKKSDLSSTEKFTEAKDKETRSGDEEDEREPIDKDTELRQVVKKFFKPADFAEKVHKSHKPQHAQSRKAKALKLLQAKANTRPFSATTYSDRVVSDKKVSSNRPVKNVRSERAEMFSEKSQILSKHGLLKNHSNTVNSNPQRPMSGSYLISIKSKDTSTLEAIEQAEADTSDIEETKSTVETISDARATYSASSRPKSASRVTFASNKDERRQRSSRISSAPCLRGGRNRRNSSRQNSAISQDSGMTLSSGVEDDAILDADAMWAELSSDDTDDEMRDGPGRQNLVTEEDFFMAKFDLLDAQFEAAKAELRQDKLKSVLKQKQVDNHDLTQCGTLVPYNPFAQVAGQEENVLCIESKAAGNVDFESHSPQPLLYTQSIFLTHSDPTAEHEPMAVKTHGKIFKPTESHELEICQENLSTLPQDSQPVMAEHQRLPLPREAQLSFQLYKKTNVYMEVSTPHRTRPNSASERKKVTRKSRKNSESHFQGETHPEDKAGKSDENGGGRTEDDIPPAVSSSKNSQPVLEDLAKEAETRKLQTKQEMQKDYPMLLGVKVELQPQDSQRSVKNTCEEVTFGTDMSEAVEENLNQCGTYQEMLDAYRRHCIEGSDESDDNSDTDTFTRLAKPKRSQRSQYKASPSTRRPPVNKNHQRSRNNVRVDNEEISDKLVSKPRPVSAVTNDSGWESDCQSTSPEEEAPLKATCNHNETTLTFSGSHTDITQTATETATALSNAVQTDVTNFMDSPDICKDSAPQIDRMSSKGLHKKQFHMPSDIGQLPAQDSLNLNLSDKEDLTVVAQAKKLSKKPSDVTEEDPMDVLCKVPPLCFKLNARPPKGFLYYFAYGPNMSRDRLCTYLQCEQPPLRFWAVLFGFGLVFNRKGTGNEAATVGGFANLEYNPVSSVEGCIFQLTPAQLDRLDAFMDYPRSHEHVVLPVWMSNCTTSVCDQDLGVAQYCVPAVTYIAQNEATWTDPIQANEFAVSQCQKAASETCSANYQEHLDSFSTMSEHFKQPLAITAA